MTCVMECGSPAASGSHFCAPCKAALVAHTFASPVSADSLRRDLDDYRLAVSCQRTERDDEHEQRLLDQITKAEQIVGAAGSSSDPHQQQTDQPKEADEWTRTSVPS